MNKTFFEDILNKTTFAFVIPVFSLVGLAIEGVDFFFDLPENTRRAYARKNFKKGTWLQNKETKEFIQITKVDPSKQSIFNMFCDFKYYFNALKSSKEARLLYLTDTQLIKNYEIKKPSKIARIIHE